MERYYRFANITFRIIADEEIMYREEGVLAPFQVEAGDFDHEVRFEIPDQLPRPEGECIYRGRMLQVFRQGQSRLTCMGTLPDAHTHILRQGQSSTVQLLPSQVPGGLKPRLVLNCLEAEHHIVHHGGILLHSSFIRVGEQAVLFTAPSGTGKSTQAELWRKFRGAEVINGDRTAVIPEGDRVMAYGIPYCGTSGISKNARLPIGAIVCLSQAKTNRLEPLKGLRAFRTLWEGCSVNLWDREDVELCIQSLQEVLRQVPVVHLACTPDESAVIALEKFLQKGEMA